MSIRVAQAGALEKMLNFNEADTDKGVSWKVLVFDKAGRDILSSVLRVADLFKAGVTLHLLLSAERYPLPDVPAIYFVEPTADNVARIGKDISQSLYQSWSINFISPLTRALLEDLASKTLANSAKINQVWDQYLDFTCLETDVFSLEMPQVYYDFANPRSTEEDINRVVDSIVNGLFCVLITIGKLPVIRATRGNAAEMIAQKLDEKLRSHISNTRHSSGLDTKVRPVLVLLDRNIDLVSMVNHPWTYQSLINDTCNFTRARITLPDKTAHDIEPTDTFWEENKTLPFPEVADNLDAALTKYKKDAEKLTGSADGLDNLDGPNTAHLKTALTSLPELTARKQNIDAHMNVATVLLKAIGERGLAQLFEAEQTASKQTKTQILDLINDKELKDPQDKLRLYLVYLLSTAKLSTTEQKEIEDALVEQGCTNLDAVAYIKHVKEISKMNLATQAQQTQAAPVSHQGALFQRVSGLTSSLTNRINQGTLTDGFGSIISGVKGFLPSSDDLLPLTKITQSILDPTVNPALTEDYLCFDPKESRGSITKPPKRTTYDDAILFMVGGGNYFEYANVEDWAAKNSKTVTYGATNIPSPSQFIETCALLGKSV